MVKFVITFLHLLSFPWTLSTQRPRFQSSVLASSADILTLPPFTVQSGVPPGPTWSNKQLSLPVGLDAHWAGQGLEEAQPAWWPCRVPGDCWKLTGHHSCLTSPPHRAGEAPTWRERMNGALSTQPCSTQGPPCLGAPCGVNAPEINV